MIKSDDSMMMMMMMMILWLVCVIMPRWSPYSTSFEVFQFEVFMGCLSRLIGLIDET